MALCRWHAKYSDTSTRSRSRPRVQSHKKGQAPTLTGSAVVGETLTATAGTFSGGVGTLKITTNIKKSDTGSGGWTNATSGLTYVLQAGDASKFFRVTSKATDDAAQSMNSDSAVVGPVLEASGYDLLVMGDPVVTGKAIVGETLTCSEPSVSGGSGEHEFNYEWKAKGSPTTAFGTGSSVVVPAGVVGRIGYCEVTAIDATADQSVTKESNEVGPVINPTEIKAVTITVDGVLTTYGEPIHCKANDALVVEAAITGDASPSYKWEARGNYPMGVSDQAATTTLTFPQEGNATVTLTVTDPTATDSPIAYAMNFYVASQAEWDALHPDA